MEARKWIAAASPTAKPQACGTHSTPCAVAVAAIFLHSVMPRAAHRSGCTMVHRPAGWRREIPSG
jgi:hypothetical protein